MADTFATSFGVLNYSGMLFNKGNIRTPLSSIIGSRAKTTNHVEFVTGQEYSSAGGTQPAISETASLTAPDASVVTRTQKTNVTQIFQETVGVSYAKMSNMGTLSGVNIENQQANPINELDFQVGAKIQKIARDMEFTFIQGAYNKAADDSKINKTRGHRHYHQCYRYGIQAFGPVGCSRHGEEDLRSKRPHKWPGAVVRCRDHVPDQCGCRAERSYRGSRRP